MLTEEDIINYYYMNAREVPDVYKEMQDYMVTLTSSSMTKENLQRLWEVYMLSGYEYDTITYQERERIDVHALLGHGGISREWHENLVKINSLLLADTYRDVNKEDKTYTNKDYKVFYEDFKRITGRKVYARVDDLRDTVIGLIHPSFPKVAEEIVEGFKQLPKYHMHLKVSNRGILSDNYEHNFLDDPNIREGYYGVPNDFSELGELLNYIITIKGKVIEHATDNTYKDVITVNNEMGVEMYKAIMVYEVAWQLNYGQLPEAIKR